MPPMRRDVLRRCEGTSATGSDVVPGLGQKGGAIGVKNSRISVSFNAKRTGRRRLLGAFLGMIFDYRRGLWPQLIRCPSFR